MMFLKQSLFISSLFLISCYSANSSYPTLGSSGSAGPAKESSSGVQVLEIAASMESTCAITTKGLACWGKHEKALNEELPQFITAPRKLTANIDDTFCVIANEGARCWGGFRLRSVLKWLGTLGLTTNPTSKSGLSQLTYPGSYSGLARTFPTEDGLGEVTFKNPRVLMSNTHEYGPYKSPFQNLDTEISDISTDGYNYFLFIKNEIWVISNDNVWTPRKLSDLTNSTQIVSAQDHVCGLLGGVVRCRKIADKSDEATTPFIIRDIKTFIKLTTAPRYEGADTCGITADALICWKWERGIANPTNTYSLPPGTFKNPTGLSVNANSICVIDEGSLKCWDKVFGQFKLVNPHDPLTDFVGHEPLQSSPILCGTVNQFSSPIGTKCATTRGFQFERVSDGWKDSSTQTVWNDKIIEYNNDNLDDAHANGSVRKSVSKRLRQADQRKDMSYEFPDGNYQS